MLTIKHYISHQNHLPTYPPPKHLLITKSPQIIQHKPSYYSRQHNRHTICLLLLNLPAHYVPLCTTYLTLINLTHLPLYHKLTFATSTTFLYTALILLKQHYYSSKQPQKQLFQPNSDLLQCLTLNTKIPLLYQCIPPPFIFHNST